jgi:DNA-binding CsgD family transcriptional regulator
MSMPRNELELQSRLNSQLYGALVLCVELAGAKLGAELGAARIYRPPQGMPVSHVQNFLLGLSPQEATCLQGWPKQRGSLLSVLPYQELNGCVFRPKDHMPDHHTDSALYDAIEQFTTVRDALCACVTLGDQTWAALTWLRCGDNTPFSVADLNAIKQAYPAMLRRMKQDFEADLKATCASGDQTIGDDPCERLSKKEQQVLSHLRRGMTEGQVAEQLDRSRHTVHVHVKSIYRKLGVFSRQELMQKLDGKG